MRHAPTFVRRALRPGIGAMALMGAVAAGPAQAEMLPPAPPMARMPIIPDPVPLGPVAPASTVTANPAGGAVRSTGQGRHGRAHTHTGPTPSRRSIASPS